MTPLLQGTCNISYRLEIVELIKFYSFYWVSLNVYVNNELYKVIYLKMYRLDNSIFIQAFKNETMFIMVVYGLLIIGVLGAIVCRTWKP